METRHWETGFASRHHGGWLTVLFPILWPYLKRSADKFSEMNLTHVSRHVVTCREYEKAGNTLHCTNLSLVNLEDTASIITSTSTPVWLYIISSGHKPTFLNTKVPI